MRRLADTLARLGTLLRRVIGAPDYERYIAHMRLAHPGATPMSFEQFERDALARRYGKGVGRCC